MVDRTRRGRAGERALPQNLYQYRQLETRNSVRMVEVLPGAPDEAIRIVLHYDTIAQMSTCVAVSYEWGGTAREHEIFCEGKRLLVTSNLHNLLKELRRSGDETFFWIDAISINQEDVEEREHQVQLMRNIYRNASHVMLWLGEADSFTEHSFQVIPVLAQEWDSLTQRETIIRGYGGLGQF